MNLNMFLEPLTITNWKSISAIVIWTQKQKILTFAMYLVTLWRILGNLDWEHHSIENQLFQELLEKLKNLLKMYKSFEGRWNNFITRCMCWTMRSKKGTKKWKPLVHSLDTQISAFNADKLTRLSNGTSYNSTKTSRKKSVEKFNTNNI